MMKWMIAALGLTALSFPGVAQVREPIVAMPSVPAGAVLPRNTRVVLSLDETLNTKSKRSKKGESVEFSVARNVLLDGYVVIPRGARAVGHVAYRTGKGGFGKSGKIELALDYVDLGDERIVIEGRQREEGEGNSDATIGTALFISVLGAGLITGHSAEIERGREVIGRTTEDVPVVFRGGAPVQGMTPTIAANGAVMAVPAEPATNAAGQRRNPNYLGPHVVCETCRP